MAESRRQKAAVVVRLKFDKNTAFISKKGSFNAFLAAKR
jgi:hypothetical protein